MSILFRTWSASVMTVFLLFCSAPSAHAHAQLVSSTPEQGTAQSEAPREIILEFSEPIDPAFVEFAVIGPDRVSHWEADRPTVKGTRLSAPVKPLGPVGRYAVSYRVLSADGHPVSGSVTFRLTSPGAGQAVDTASARGSASVPAPAQSEQDSVPIWPWIVGGVALLVLGALVAYRVARDPDGS